MTTKKIPFNIEMLARAVSVKYRGDALTAGLVVACLQNGTFYVSIARYPSRDKKLIVCSAKGPTLDATLHKVAAEWRAQNKAASVYAAPSSRGGPMGRAIYDNDDDDWALS
jgi:hypothetical protein